MAETLVKAFTFDDHETCKWQWEFTLSMTSAGWVIDDLQVTPHRKPDGTECGCKGHPKTIIALLKGRLVNSISTDDLLETQCAREMSCGHALAECVIALKALPSKIAVA